MVLRIIEMIATSGFLAAFECTNSFSAGAPPRIPPAELTALPDLLAGLRGPTFKWRGREGKGERKGNGIGSEMEEPPPPPLTQIHGSVPEGSLQ